MGKKIEFTGSPKSAGFKTKATFLAALEPYGYSKTKMTKKNNVVDILVTDDINSTSSKMELAKELGIEIMTYVDIIDAFDLEGDI
jgi:hypothetical protein